MPAAVQLDPIQVFQAVKDEVQLWRNLQIGAIRGFNTGQLPYLSEAPPLFHAAVWFGVGMDAASKFLPGGSAAVRLVSRAAVPLALLDYGTKYFARAYAQTAAQQRLVLQGNGEAFKHRLINGVVEGERGFYTDPTYGGPLIEKLKGLIMRDRFEKQEKGPELIREVLRQSGAITTDSQYIAAHTRAAMEKVALVVEHIYRASKYAPATHKQLKVSNSRGPFEPQDFQASNCRLSRDLLARMKPGEKVGYLDASGRNPHGVQGHPAGDPFSYVLANDQVINAFLLNAWRYESRHGRGGPFNQCTATWLWQASQPVDPNYLASTYQGSLQAVDNTYRALRGRYVAT